jgi:hypothetical protein
VVDVPDRPDIDVRLAAVKFFFCHTENLLCKDSLQEPKCRSRGPALYAFTKNWSR